MVFAFDTTNNTAKTGDAANITCYVSKDYGTVTVLADTSATEMDATNAKGYYLFDAAQGETNGDCLMISAKSTTANISVIGAPAVIYTRPTTNWLAPTVLNRTLDVASTGEAGLDFDNINSTTTATLNALTVTGALTVSNGIAVTCSTSNRSAVTFTGNGTGSGLISTSGSGATGDGIQATSAATNGNGFALLANGTGNGFKISSVSGDALLTSVSTSGHGATFAGTGTTKHGINATGGATTSHGINALGGGVGHGILATGGGSAASDGIRASGGATSGIGFNCIGVGTTFPGIKAAGGTTTSAGMNLVGGGTSGDGLLITTTSGHGINVSGGGTTKHGIFATGGATTSAGMALAGGGTSGDGLLITATSGHGINSAGTGTTKHGALLTGGATTSAGLACTGGGTSGDGILISATSGHGINVAGGGTTKHGINSVGGATTSAGLALTGGGTSGAGILIRTTSGHGVDIAATGTSMHGMTITGGNGGTSDGLKCVAGTGGVDIRGGITGNITGTLSTVTTVTNQLTAAQIATGIWQDTTAGDFTTASSIGKSLYTSGVVPGGSGGLFIAGSNAATTVNITGSLSGSVGSVTAQVTANTTSWAGGTIPSPNVTGVPLVDDKYLLGTIYSTPATAGIQDINVKNMNNVAATSITTINANQGTTQPINYTGTGASALVKSDLVDIAGVAVNTASAQLGVNVVTNGDKTGYSLTQAFPSNFSSLSITAAGLVAITSNRKKASAATFEFLMQDSTTGAPKTGLTITSVISKDGGAAASTSNSATEIGLGQYQLVLTAAEMTANNIFFQCTATGAITYSQAIQTQP